MFIYLKNAQNFVMWGPLHEFGSPPLPQIATLGTDHRGNQHCRLRIWDLVTQADGPPDREIVHSHDFNRYLTPFRAEWDPKDPYERLAVVGR